MSDITINYKGNAIATMDASGTKTLLTEGKYCEDDIDVVYDKPSGGVGDTLALNARGALTTWHTTELTSVLNHRCDYNGITTIVAPNVTSIGTNAFAYSSKLKYFDAGDAIISMAQGAFTQCSALDVIIIRKASGIVTLANTTIFNNTPFASGGAGGTIYIPKAFYDHLGDGSTLDYKAATNWSTIDGYGTITWAKIEGSQYENYYADGTPIT